MFGIVGNVGTPTAAVAPYALERRMLFFGAFTGPTSCATIRRIATSSTIAPAMFRKPTRSFVTSSIAAAAPDRGLCAAGSVRRFRICGRREGVPHDGRERQRDPSAQFMRETPSTWTTINQLKLAKPPIKAVVMVATYRAAARFIEKTRDAYPGMIYSNVSFVGSTALAEELKLLGPRYTNGVIVTQVVPAVSGYSSAVLEYKNALAKYFPGEAPDYVSFEGYVAANVLIRASSGRTAARYREADRHAGDDAQSRPRSRDPAEPAAPSTRPRTRCGARRSMRADAISRSNSNDQNATVQPRRQGTPYSMRLAGIPERS